MKGGIYVSPNFWNKLRVKALIDAYVDEGINYALIVGKQYQLTNEETWRIFIMSLNQKLANLTGMWKKVQPIAPSVNTVEDGDYVAKLKEIKIGEAKNSGRLQAVSTYVIADGEYADKTVKKFDGLEDESNIGHFKHYVSVLGYDLSANPMKWQQELDSQIGADQTLWNITVKMNGQYQNVYNNGASELTAGEELEGAEAEEVTEEIEEGTEEAEEVVEEETVEEVVEEQEVELPRKKVVAAKPIAKPVVKVATMPTKVIPKKVVAKR